MQFDFSVGIGFNYVDWENHAEMNGLSYTALISLAGFGIVPAPGDTSYNLPC